MPATRPNLAQVPVNSDALDWTGGLATLADSLEVIIPVASDSAGDTIATSRAASGFPVSDARPLFVYNTTTKLFRVKDSSGWRDLDYPLGLLQMVEITSPSGLSGTTQFIAQSIGSFTFKANRNYEVTAIGALHSSVANASPIVHLYTCATTDPVLQVTGTTEINGYNVPCVAANQTQRWHASRKIKYGVDTTLQLKVGIHPVNGDTVSIDCGATFPLQFSVTDLGANF